MPDEDGIMSTSRLAEVDPVRFTAEERELFNEVAAVPHNPAGPTAIWSRSPRLAKAALAFGDFVRFDSGLPARVRELAILVTARAWDCENEWVAHEPLARRAGLSAEVIAAVSAGAVPTTADAQERAAYDLAVGLHELRDVDDRIFAAAAAQFGDRGVVELISTVGFYAMVAMLLKGTRAPVRRR